MSEFIDMLAHHGLLDDPDVQQQAISSLCQGFRADYIRTRRLINGDVIVRFYRHDEDNPVGRAIVDRHGRTTVDVTEDIA